MTRQQPPMSPAMQKLAEKQAAERLAQQQRDDIGAAARAIDLQSHKLIRAQIGGDPQTLAAFDATYFSGGDLSGFQVARYAAAEDVLPRDSGNPYTFYSESSRAALSLFRAGQPLPDGFEIVEGFDLNAHRSEGHERAARVNSRASVPAWQLNSHTDVRRGEAESGIGARIDPRTGETIFESRAAPMSADEELASALDEVRTMMADAEFPPEVIAAVEKHIRKNVGNDNALSMMGVARSFVSGPEGGVYAYGRAVMFDPANAQAWPRAETHGAGARTITARKLLQVARDRRDIRQSYGTHPVLSKSLW